MLSFVLKLIITLNTTLSPNTIPAIPGTYDVSVTTEYEDLNTDFELAVVGDNHDKIGTYYISANNFNLLKEDEYKDKDLIRLAYACAWDSETRGVLEITNVTILNETDEYIDVKFDSHHNLTVNARGYFVEMSYIPPTKEIIDAYRYVSIKYYVLFAVTIFLFMLLILLLLKEQYEIKRNYDVKTKLHSKWM